MTYSQELLAEYLSSHSMQELQVRQAEIMAKGKSAVLTVGELALITDEQRALFWSFHPLPPRVPFDPTPWVTDGKWESKLYGKDTPCQGYWQPDRGGRLEHNRSSLEDEAGL